MLGRCAKPVVVLLFGCMLASCGKSNPTEPAPPNAGTTFSVSDLGGTWAFNSLASGAANISWWERASAEFDAAGHLRALAADNGGGSDSIHATFALSATGVLTLDGSTTFGGVMDLGKNVIVGTDTWTSGGPATEMKIGVRKGASYASTDVAGTWRVCALAAGGGAPWWMRGTMVAAADGSCSYDMTEDDGANNTGTGSVSITSGGVVSLSIYGPGGLGVMDASKSVVVTTATWSSGTVGTPELGVWIKSGTGYSSADLSGTWHTCALATGPGAPWWQRGQIVFSGSGNYTGNMLANNGSTQTVGGTLAITADGTVTESGSTTLRGYMNAARNLMVICDTWSGGSAAGTASLTLAIKSN